ncbi:chromate transporter [Lacisediminimonas profundi]|uniref:chromate transporter n=1 Tax=Lacisediminimonas profundi TaxID=2603856 RepID=UPI00124B9CCF|nr:chromate transporter [Lacisediminimonas profundi]
MQTPPAPASESRNQPKSLSDLFISFTLLALQGFGGVLAIVQREIVEKKRWMTREEFVEEWSVAQIMPGPNVINLALMIGGRYFGLRGALVALAGMLAAPLLVVLLLAIAYAQLSNHPGVAGALRGMGAVAAGLIISTGLKLAPALKYNPLGMPVCLLLMAAAFVAIAWLRWPMMLVLPALGIVACTAAWRALRDKGQA